MQFRGIRASIFRMFANRKSIIRPVLTLFSSELSEKNLPKINCKKRIYFFVNFTPPANQNVICHVDFQLAQQRSRITGAGGEPSTWFPPGELVEPTSPPESSRDYAKLEISKNEIVQKILEFFEITNFPGLDISFSSSK